MDGLTVIPTGAVTSGPRNFQRCRDDRPVRLSDLPSEQSSSATPAPGLPAARQAVSIYSLSSVTFAVEGRTLLHPLNLELEAGRVHGLIGHNGSGKSTLIKLLARQQPATGGIIRFGNRPLAEWSNRALAPQGRIPAAANAGRTRHDRARARGLSAATLGTGRWGASRVPTARKSRRRCALPMSPLLPTGWWRTSPVANGSGPGSPCWWRRTANACFWTSRFPALDIAHQIEILNLVRQLSRSRDLSVVVVLHDINMAARFCDELIALRGGRVLVRGSCTDIMTPQALEAIYGVPMGILPHPESGIPISFAR